MERTLTLLVLPLKFLAEGSEETVVEVLIAQVSVTSVTGGGFDLEDAFFDGQNRDVEGSSVEIEDENVVLAHRLLVETVGDSGSRGLVDNVQNAEASDRSSVV